MSVMLIFAPNNIHDEVIEPAIDEWSANDNIDSLIEENKIKIHIAPSGKWLADNICMVTIAAPAASLFVLLKKLCWQNFEAYCEQLGISSFDGVVSYDTEII